MASTYVNDLRLEEMATGDQSGTWGETTNTNLELISEAFSFGTEAITTNADTHTTSIADGATDPGRSMYLKYTGTLDSACTITIGPNTVSKMWFIENGTSGSQNIIISQGSGANITIPPGDVKVVYSDGAGSGAAVVDAFASLSVVDLKVQDDLTVTDDLIVNGDIDLEGNMDVNGSLETDALSLNGTTVTSTAAEINLLDGSSANTVVNSKAVIYGSSGEVAGTLSTAAQPNITSVGTLTGFTSTGIDDNATSTAITIDSSENVGIGTASPSRELELSAANPRFRITDTDGGYAEISGNSGHLSFAADLGGTQGGTRITFDVDGGEIARFNSSGKLGIGTTTIPAKLTVSAASATGGILLQDSNTSSAAPTVQVIGQRSDGNASQSFSGGLALAQNQTDQKGSDNKKLGTVYFGINHTDGTAANIAYSASISAELSGDANSATDMPTDLCFYTGSTGRDLGTANQTYGDEALRIAASGNVGIGESSPLGKLHVKSADSGAGADAGADELVVEGSGDSGLSILSGASNNGTILFSDSGDSAAGGLRYEQSNNALNFRTNGAWDRLYIDSSGNCGLGTGSPNRPLEIKATSAAIRLQQTGGAYAEITSSDFGILYLNADAGNTASGTSMRFLVDNSEAARIDNEGNFLIGKTTHNVNNTQGVDITTEGAVVATNADGISFLANRTGSDGQTFLFRRQNVTVGSISVTGSATTYATSSDYRLKENVDYDFTALDRVAQLKPARFNFIATPTVTVDGFVAHEVQDVVPEAIIGEKDGEKMQGIDQSKLVPLLTKAIQEQQTMIDDLKTRIEALEA